MYLRAIKVIDNPELIQVFKGILENIEIIGGLDSVLLK